MIIVLIPSSLVPSFLHSSWDTSLTSTVADFNINDASELAATNSFPFPSLSPKKRIVILAIGALESDDGVDGSNDGVNVATRSLQFFLTSPFTEIRVEEIHSMFQWQRAIQGKEVIFQGDVLFVVGHRTESGNIILSSSAATAHEPSELTTPRLEQGISLEEILKVSGHNFRQVYALRTPH